MRRRAAMTRTVLPRTTTHEVWLLAGRAERDQGDGVRAPPVDENGDSAASEDDNEDGMRVDSGGEDSSNDNDESAPAGTSAADAA